MFTSKIPDPFLCIWQRAGFLPIFAKLESVANTCTYVFDVIKIRDEVATFGCTVQGSPFNFWFNYHGLADT